MISGIIYVKQTDPRMADLFGDTTIGYVESGLPDFILNEVKHLDNLYFFGSRSKMFIDPDNKESDWDFALPSSYDTNKLSSMGFKYKNDDYLYQDGMTFEVYEKEVEGHIIQLVLKGDINIFRNIWDHIPVDFYQRFLNKRSEHYLGKEWVQTWFAMMANISRDRIIAYEDMV